MPNYKKKRKRRTTKKRVRSSTAVEGARDGDDNIAQTPREIPGTDMAANNPMAYELENKKHAMIIFNHNIDDMKPLNHSQDDADLIKTTLEKFGFSGNIHLNLTRNEIMTTLKTFSHHILESSDQYGCVVIVVNTHGKDLANLMSKDEPYGPQTILNDFKHRAKPKLVEKPVILIIQAYVETGEPMTDNCPKTFTPPEAHGLMLYNLCSDRNGPRFIKSFCQHIEKLWDKDDLISIFLKVKAEVIKNCSAEINTIADQTTLMGKIYFKKVRDDQRPPQYDGSSENTRKDQHENPNHNENKAKVISLPIFSPDQPELWFSKIEGLFHLNHITEDDTMFHYITTHLDYPHASMVQSVITNPPAQKKYKTLKNSLIETFSVSTTVQNLSKIVMGDDKPSQFFKRLHEAAVKLPHKSLLDKWLDGLPADMQPMLQALPLEKLLSNEIMTFADHLHDFVGSRHVIHKKKVQDILDDMNEKLPEWSRRLDSK